MNISRDEIFILFYNFDKDGDGFISYSELSKAFLPKQEEYSKLISSRKPFYGEFTPV